jgi:succinate dehydrogenase/fumarate reductase flavoprotein subunit
MNNISSLDFDVLIVGSGLAGLSAALHLAPTHRVAVITKRALRDGSSSWAQGGIAAVLGEGDTFESHVDDTLVAGAGLSQLDATRFVVEHAPESVGWLRQLGVPFSEEHGQLHLTREELSVREHMSIVLRKLQGRKFVEFEHLFDPSRGVPVLIVTFIAMLELAKETLIDVTQAEAYAPIYVRLAYSPA